MGSSKIHIVHVETGRHVYGGPRQVLLLMHGLNDRGLRNTLVCPARSDVETAARQQGLTVLGIPVGGDLDVGLYLRLVRALRDTHPDLVHVHSRRGADLFGGLAALRAGLPAVLTRRVDSRDWPLVGRFKYASYRRVIAISARIRRQLLDSGLPAERLHLVQSAVPAPPPEGPALEAAEFRAEFDFPDNVFPVAVVAQLIARKGHRYLLEALAQLKTRFPQIRVVLFGVGRLDRALEQQSRDLGVDDMVRFVGYYPEVNRIIGRFSLLVHPARREGLGVSVLEAQAARVPVVGFRAGGLSEAVADGQTGLLVPPGDVGALAAAIAALIEDPQRRHELAAAGPAHVDAHFGLDAMVDGNLSVYKDLLGLSQD